MKLLILGYLHELVVWLVTKMDKEHTIRESPRTAKTLNVITPARYMGVKYYYKDALVFTDYTGVRDIHKPWLARVLQAGYHIMSPENYDRWACITY